MAGQNSAPVLAADIGGTKILTAILSSRGRMLAKDVCSTLADEGVSSVIERLCASIDNLLNGNNFKPSSLAGIGIACAGAIDAARGVITTSPNLPEWSDVPLAGLIAERYGVDTYLVNDASAAALGEHRFGAGQGLRNLVMLTLGTGIGGGIIIDGELYLGASGSAAEMGHMIIDVNGPECPCGSKGCLEVFASGTAVARDAAMRIGQGEKSSLVDMVQGRLEEITAGKVGAAARNGDALAIDVFSRAAYYLGIGLVNIVNIFNLEMIIIGGGMAEQAEFLLEPARQVVAAGAFPISAQAVRIVPAKLGNEAGVYGAAAYAFDQAKRRS
jgi:glucokinase